jgi:hypothetical protein
MINAYVGTIRKFKPLAGFHLRVNELELKGFLKLGFFIFSRVRDRGARAR